MTPIRRSVPILAAGALVSTLVIATACGGASVPGEHGGADDRLLRVAENLQQPLVIEGQPVERWQIEDRMRRFSVPGVSVAVIDEGRLAAAHAWGVLVAGGDEPLTTETMLQAGSISKPVAALVALTLVGDGVLALDRPINEVLRSWKVPDNEFTREAPVTLRHVMTHQAGFTPFGYLIPRADATVPGMAELLKGGIHDWPVVAPEFVPGSRHAYSNSGYCVLQLVLEDASGLGLHELAAQRLFGPLGMGHSTFDEPLEPAVLASVASGHTRASGGWDREPTPVEGKADIAPAATGGLWSTPSDLARLVVEVMRAWRDEGDGPLQAALAREFLTPQADTMGLGIYVEGENPDLRARHGGGMTGFVAHLVFYPNAGKGAVVMASSGGGRWLNQELMAAVASEYGWPGFPVRRTLATATAGQLAELVGTYSLDAAPEYTVTFRLEDGTAVGQIGQYPPFELTPTTDRDIYVVASESLEVVFQRADDGAISRVVLRRAGDAGNTYSRRVD